MVNNTVQKEFRKISGSFGKVRLDMNKMYSLVSETIRKQEELQEEIKYLKAELALFKIDKNSSKTNEEIIVGNIESKKFHYSSCPFAKNIKTDNKMTFENIEKAVKAGYTECSCIREN